jgi:hypothetical protein
MLSASRLRARGSAGPGRSCRTGGKGACPSRCGLGGLLLALCVALGACGNGAQWSGPAPSPDFAIFQSSVYPMLLRNCAFSACHGDPARFFQVYGPGRTRLDSKLMSSDAATQVEVQRSYDRARSMLATASTVQDSLLLRKPLQLDQGGQGHKGTDAFGRNVFGSKMDPDYILLAQWASGRQASATISDAGAKP